MEFHAVPTRSRGSVDTSDVMIDASYRFVHRESHA
jgi:hypothetical protein